MPDSYQGIMPRKQKIDLRSIAWDAMQRYGFSPRFPKSVLRETDRKTPPDISRSMRGVTNLTHLLWSSIDNADSEDLDQIEYCEKGPNGEIHVKVAIADVDLYVPRGTVTDRHASHNTTSVYTGIVTFPMLPDHLSKGISSLLPGNTCPAIVIGYTVLTDGTIRFDGISQALVLNKAKMVYEEVGEWLLGTSPEPAYITRTPGLREQVQLQNEAASRLRTRRRQQGALDLETLEAEVIRDGDVVVDIVVQRPNPARFIIEEFMVAANQTVVHALNEAHVPMIHRVVRLPKYWEEIRLVAARYGETLPADPDARALSAFLTTRRQADPERFTDLSLTVVKLMGSGEYVAYMPGKIPIGHFALAVTDYTHSTAPNRRYPDLIIQRILKAVLTGKKSPYHMRELEELAEWISEREKDAKKVERFMLKSSAAMLLMDRIGEEFEAIVTGASEKGVYARLLPIPVEGRITLHERGLKVGEKIMVRLMKTDPFNGHIDLDRIKSAHP